MRYYTTLLRLTVLSIAILISSQAFSQEKERGTLSGDLQLIGKFYEADSLRQAINTPFYDYLFYGADAFLNVRYGIAGFDAGIRFDVFNNSATFNPTRETNAQAIGRWYVSKKIDKLSMSGGFLYDQFGTGTIFRAYENRALGIDQSLFGVIVAYELSKNWKLKAFTGRIKRQIDPDLSTVKSYSPVLKGFNADGFIKISDKFQLVPGISAVGRTIDTKTMQTIVNEINAYPTDSQRFTPNYNTYAIQLYNTFNIGDVSWYVEGAYKTEDILRDLDGNLYQPQSGYVGYTTLTYARKGLGIVLQGKYTKDFDFRTSPNETINNGLIHYLPAMTRLNSGRLTARYNPATQLLGEMAVQADVNYSTSRYLGFNFNFSHLRDLDTTKLFQELYLESEIKPKGKKWKTTIGIQAVDYNQLRYEQKGDWVNTLTTFADFTYKFDKKKSIKAELSYMLTKRNYRLFGKTDPHPEKTQDLGDLLWAMAEFSIAPSWSFSVADMYAVDKKIHYPTLYGSYSINSTRFALSYAKQPAGIICTGGICRFEPAFSGVRLDVTTSF
jgi:hypothetical protein